MNAETIIEILGLEPLPGEGGFFRESYRSANSSAIYYLVTPASYSRLHRLPKDELLHFYLGDPVETVQIDARGDFRREILGADLGAGERPQVLVPARTWQGSRLKAGGSYALLGATLAPGYEPSDLELADGETLAKQFPRYRELILELSR